MGERARSDGRVRVAICIASFRRPEGLRALLRSLDALAFEGDPPDVRVIVADNDPTGSARAVCEDARDWLRHPLHCVVETRRGIPQARNASLAPALASADWVAFVDDDETVAPHWLDALLRAQRASGADAVTGPVEPRFVETPPAWIVEGGFFAYPRFADGASRPVAHTNNALVRASALQDLGSLFDEGMRTGEDTELFSRLARRGHSIVWAAAAQVVESIPPQRANLAYLLRRGVREGIAQVGVERRLNERGPLAIVVRGTARLVGGVLLAALPLPRGRAVRARALKGAALGVGRLVGLAVWLAGPRPSVREP